MFQGCHKYSSRYEDLQCWYHLRPGPRKHNPNRPNCLIQAEHVALMLREGLSTTPAGALTGRRMAMGLAAGR